MSDSKRVTIKLGHKRYLIKGMPVMPFVAFVDAMDKSYRTTQRGNNDAVFFYAVSSSIYVLCVLKSSSSVCVC